MESTMDLKMTRREFLELSGAYAAAATLPGLVYPRHANAEKYPLAEILKPENYKKATSHWHPIFGPSVETSSIYGGRADFAAHRRYFGEGGGLDFYAHEGTPLVPPAAGMVMNVPPRSHRSGLGVRLLHEKMRVNYPDPGMITSEFYHLYSVLVQSQFIFQQTAYENNARFSFLRRNEIFALSGATGEGMFQGKQHPHAHWETWKRKDAYGVVPYEAFDQETCGIDKDFPLVFWDGKTVLDILRNDQFRLLRHTVGKYSQKDLVGWEETHNQQELAGKLADLAKKAMKQWGKEVKGKDLLDSKHFIDMKALIKDEVLRKERYQPGSGPYTAMLEILGHGKDPKQDIIFTLPFISPNLVGLYRKPAGDSGLFRQWWGIYTHKGKTFKWPERPSDAILTGQE